MLSRNMIYRNISILIVTPLCLMLVPESSYTLLEASQYALLWIFASASKKFSMSGLDFGDSCKYIQMTHI